MSDTKLDPASLTAEERAIVDHEASRFHRDWAASARYQAAMNLCEPIILARRALFAPPASEEKVTCPNCGDAVEQPWLHFPGGWRCPTLPAKPERVEAERVDTTKTVAYCDELDARYGKPAATEMPEAAVDDDMPEQVSDAVRKLNRQGRYTATAHRLVAWFRASFPRVPCSVCSWPTNSDGSCARCSSRNSSQPVTPPLAMSEELERVLQTAVHGAAAYMNAKMYGHAEESRLAIAAVRQQATATKMVKMVVVRSVLEKLLSEHPHPEMKRNPEIVAALAELDAVEGR